MGIFRSNDYDGFDGRRVPYRRPFMQRVRRGCCCCGCLLLLLITLGAGVVAIKAGVVTVPVISHWLYRLPTPTRWVAVQPRDIQSLSIALQEAARSSSVTTSVKIDEQQLTAIIRQLIAATAAQTFAPTAQAVITPKHIEFSALLLRPYKMNVMAAIRPLITSAGELTIELDQLQVGSLDVPPPLIKVLSGTVVTSLAERLQATLRQLGQLSSITLFDNYLSLQRQNPSSVNH